MKKILNIVGVLFLIGCIGSIFQGCGGGKGAGSSNRSLEEILDENDFASANKYVADVFTKAEKDYFPHGRIVDKYLPAAIKTLKAEASYLMDQDDPDAETLFMLCINDVAGNIANYQPVTGFFDGTHQTETEFISDEVTPYNACLISIIREAVIKNKPDFAKKVFKMMKTNYKCEKHLKPGMDSKWAYNYTYEYSEDNSQIEEAQKLLSELE